MPTLLITNALIIDGTGQAPYAGHVLTEGERIAAVVRADSPEAADLQRRGAERVVDAGGLALSPGFIDAHSHFDWVLPLGDHAEILAPLVEQGVTTVVSGNCGYSPAPVPPGAAGRLNAYGEFVLERPLEVTWEGLGSFLETLEGQGGLLFNNAQLAGHGTCHLGAVRDLERPPGEAELEAVCDLLRQALDEGAFGLSLGLMYPPGMFYDRRALEQVARVAAEGGRVLTVHMRALSRYSGAWPVVPFFGQPHNLRALEEMLAIGLETGVRLELSHLIFVGRRSWPTAGRAIAMIEEAASRGLEVGWDIYPHFCGNSYLNVFLPAWFMQDFERNLRSRRALARLTFELTLAQHLLGFRLSDIQIMEAGIEGGERYNGLNLEEIGRMEGLSAMGAFLKLIRESSGKALQLTYGYSGDEEHEGLIERLMAHERCLFMTDTILKSKGFANPASYGAFPRILGRYVRERRVLSLSEAVGRMTSRTARWFGIPERGELREGYFADLALWDPETIADTTTRADTARRPLGIASVFINGEQVVEQGVWLEGSRRGRALRAG